jgi:hypothetical protein
MKFFLYLCLAAGILPAQNLHVGLKGGVPLSDTFNAIQGPGGVFQDKTRPFTIGPMLAVDLPARLGFEFDILYKRLGYQFENVRTSGNSWEFPVLGKYFVGPPGVKPFVGGGVSFRRLPSLEALREKKGNTGVVITGGIEARFLLRASAELRYTRWTGESIGALVGRPGGVLRSTQNQAEFLVGLTF